MTRCAESCREPEGVGAGSESMIAWNAVIPRRRINTSGESQGGKELGKQGEVAQGS